MSGLCEELDPETIAQAKLYYYELLNGLSERYNNFHWFIYQFLCIIGVIANICFVVVLLRPTMRKNPFNLFLIVIAICDMSLMASYFIYKQVEMCHPWYFTFFWIVYTYGYAVLSVFVHSASLWLTVNMAVLRYLVLKSGSSSSRRWPRLNTYKAASGAVVSAVLLAAVGSAPNMLRYEIRSNGQLAVPNFCVEAGAKYAHSYQPGQLVNAYTLGQPAYWGCAMERFSFWTAGVLLKLVPCLLLTIFMTLLVRMLVEARERRSRLIAKQAPPPAASQNESSRSVCQAERTAGGGSSCSKAQAERTTAMLTIIVAVFLITELPQGILVIAIGVKPQVRFAMHQLSNIIDLLSLLNSSVNFILYATMSNLFRHEFLLTFGPCCPTRLFAWLHQHNEEKASPQSPTRPMEHGTLMTGLNGSSKLIRTSPPNGFTKEKRHLWAVNGHHSSIQNPKLAPKLANCTTARNSLPVPYTSHVVSVLRKSHEHEKMEPLKAAENEAEQRRRLLAQNGAK
ncbi:hypothetical protein niasHS_001064 [Heterodera schachtii]|uniref:G-protein coupled receptors family 1 profile domain-containing protein n=1 Tax=Heterodera schachtii TaxID=97005 RepID=A0ABD2K862_HETSC